MTAFTTLLRPTTENPPLSWIEDDPEWWDPTEGRGIQIIIDPDHDEAGRAIGYVSPPGGERCYMNVPGACLPTPSGSPDGFRTFHAEIETFLTADGDPVTRPIGSIPLGGGHSSPVLVRTPEESAEFLQRKERWQRLVEDIGLYGTITDTERGLLFRGWVAPNVTVAEADAINKTVMSGEWIPDPELGGQRVFAGVVRVRRTALPMRDLPMTASLDDPAAVLYTYAPADMAQFPTEGDTDMPPETEPTAVRANVEDILAEVQAQQADIVQRLETIEGELAAFGQLAVEDAAADSAGPGQTFDDLVALVAEQGNKLNGLIDTVERQQAKGRSQVNQARTEPDSSQPTTGRLSEVR